MDKLKINTVAAFIGGNMLLGTVSSFGYASSSDTEPSFGTMEKPLGISLGSRSCSYAPSSVIPGSRKGVQTVKYKDQGVQIVEYKDQGVQTVDYKDQGVQTISQKKMSFGFSPSIQATTLAENSCFFEEMARVEGEDLRNYGFLGKIEKCCGFPINLSKITFEKFSKKYKDPFAFFIKNRNCLGKSGDHNLAPIRILVLDIFEGGHLGFFKNFFQKLTVYGKMGSRAELKEKGNSDDEIRKVLEQESISMFAENNREIYIQNWKKDWKDGKLLFFITHGNDLYSVDFSENKKVIPARNWKKYALGAVRLGKAIALGVAKLAGAAAFGSAYQHFNKNVEKKTPMMDKNKNEPLSFGDESCFCDSELLRWMKSHCLENNNSTKRDENLGLSQPLWTNMEQQENNEESQLKNPTTTVENEDESWFFNHLKNNNPTKTVENEVEPWVFDHFKNNNPTTTLENEVEPWFPKGESWLSRGKSWLNNYWFKGKAAFQLPRFVWKDFLPLIGKKENREGQLQPNTPTMTVGNEGKPLLFRVLSWLKNDHLLEENKATFQLSQFVWKYFLSLISKKENKEGQLQPNNPTKRVENEGKSLLSRALSWFKGHLSEEDKAYFNIPQFIWKPFCHLIGKMAFEYYYQRFRPLSVLPSFLLDHKQSILQSLW
jgi:hypothetical protein